VSQITAFSWEGGRKGLLMKSPKMLSPKFYEKALKK
jgi:hypothetical protein